MDPVTPKLYGFTSTFIRCSCSTQEIYEVIDGNGNIMITPIVVWMNEWLARMSKIVEWGCNDEDWSLIQVTNLCVSALGFFLRR